MRNLKRALSLTLASVMLLGMMIMGTSAAGFPDVDEENNVEAIEVLNAVGVILGDDNGDFRPDDLVTRAEMAAIMSRLLDLDYKYFEATCPFTDVPDWAKGYVGACYANGVIKGYNATTYGSTDGITPVQAAAMMMRALGYFKYNEDYASGFEVATVRQGSEIGIFEGVGSSATASMTRDQVAKMSLNALKSEMVAFTGTPGMEVNGVVVGYRAEYTPRTSTETKYQAIERRTSDVSGGNNLNRGQYYIQLGEELYNGDLRLNDSDLDVFCRPARTWEFKGKEIGTYVKTELLKKTYTDKVTGRDLYDLLTANTISNYSFLISFDGETDPNVLNQVTVDERAPFTPDNLVRTNTDTLGRTGKGVLTEVYVDIDTYTVYISIINTYVAKANEDYNTKDEDVDLVVYGVDFVAGGTALVKDTSDSDTNTTVKEPFKETLSPSSEDFEMIKDIKKNDILLVNVAEGEIQIITKPETLSAVSLSAFSRNKYVITDGTQYDYANTALYDPEVLDAYTSTAGNINLKDLTYNVYLDEYGYLIGVELVEDPTQYVFITGTEGGYSDLNSARTSMRAIFTDGTIDVIDVDLVRSDATVRDSAFRAMGPIINTWCTYTVNNSGVYTLKAVPLEIGSGKIAQWAQGAHEYANNGSSSGIRGTSAYTIDKGHITLMAKDDKRVYGNDKTIYINAEMGIIAARTNLTTQLPGNISPLNGNTVSSAGNGLTNGILNDGANASDPNYVAGTTQSGLNPRTVIINDVDSVVVGVANASIKTISLSEAYLEGKLKNGNSNPDDLVFPKNEIYTLYNDKGIVIAAVVLGDDQGSGTKLAVFPNSEPSEERWVSDDSRASTNGYWTWSREAIVDGELVTLVEKDESNLDQLSAANIKLGDLVEISYDADGNVRRANNLTRGTLGAANGTFVGDNATGKYITDITSVEVAAEDNNTVVLYANYTNGDHTLRYSNGTLYRDNDATHGIHLRDDTKIIVALAKLKNNVTGTPGNINDVDQYKTISKTYTGAGAMTDALNALDYNFDGYVIAVVKDHEASCIILNDTYGKRVTTTGNNVNQGGGYPQIHQIYAPGYNMVVDYYDANYGTANQMTYAAIAEAGASAASKFLGMNVKNAYTTNGRDVYAYVENGIGLFGTQVTIRMDRVVKVSVDGTLYAYAHADETALNMSTKNGLDSLATNKEALTGKVLVNEYSASSATLATANIDVATLGGKDVNLYTACEVLPDSGITMTLTEKNGTTAQFVGDGTRTAAIAKGTTVTLEMAGLTDGTTYQLTADGTPIGTALQASDSVTTLTVAYKVVSDVAISSNSGTAIKVKTANGGIVNWVAGASVTIDQLGEKANVVAANYGNYVKVTPATPAQGAPSYTLVSDGSIIPAAGSTYELGYYKVTLPTTGAAVDGVTYTVSCAQDSDGDGVIYVKKGETFSFVITTGGTATGTTAKVITVADGTMVDGTVAPAANTTFGTGTAVISSNTLTITPVVSGSAVNAVYTITVTVPGTGDVTFS